MSESFDELVAIMSRLRSPGGCPWDAEQTYASLSQYLLEEAYEAFDAIHVADETGDTAELCEELGDLLLQVIFHATIGKERQDFDIDDAVKGVAKKLVLRHPHVFGDAKFARGEDTGNKIVQRRRRFRQKVENQLAHGQWQKIRAAILTEA